MSGINTELLLIILCCIVVLSYLYSIISQYIKIPSVLLLLFTGMAARWIADKQHWGIVLPETIVEFLGSIGLIMIVLEAGLDLKLGASKKQVIRQSFFSAFVILFLSIAGLTFALQRMLQEDVLSCLVYAIPLSIMSSSIVIPSLHHLSETKKEFLVYEASFSDMLGILVFNYFTAKELLTLYSFGNFLLNIVIAVALSLFFSVLLFIILTKTNFNIKFFLVFSLLIILYEGGKMFGLPSLLIILMFGMLVNNWNLLHIPRLQKLFPKEKVEEAVGALHFITAETSFLIRTFFFLIFGFSINIASVMQPHIAVTGTVIVLVLLLVRFLYLRFFLRESVYPEVFFIPRGLITILLFYKIPPALKLENFDEGIMFFIILVSSLIMTIGILFYRKKASDLVEED